jgi:DNA-binding XRE family transcriptional regulator
MGEVLSCGIPYLDKIMGGYCLGDNIVWVLTPETDFDIFLEAFLTKKDGPHFKIVYVSFDFPPQKILNRYEKLFKPEDFILVDAFTFGKGNGDRFFQSFYQGETIESKPFRIYCIKDLTEPSEFIRTMSSLQEECKTGIACKYFFGSLNGMQELWGERDTLHFFTFACPKLFELKALAYWPLVKEAHSKSFLANISYITQVVISLSFEEDNPCSVRFLKLEGRSSKLLNTTHYYNVQEKNIDFLNPLEQAEIAHKSDTQRIPKQEQEPTTLPSFLETKEPIRIGGRIRDSRLAKNLSQVELAQKLSITPSALSQIENNRSLPSLPLFIQIARFFGKSLDSFFSPEPKKLEVKTINQ